MKTLFASCVRLIIADIVEKLSTINIAIPTRAIVTRNLYDKFNP